MGKRLLVIGGMLLLAATAQAVDTKDLASGLTAADLVKALTGAGIQISNAKVTGAPAAIGTFTGGSSDGFEVDSGVIMSSGNIATAKGPNNSESTTGSMGQPGDAGLDALVAPRKTQDAVILEFDAVTTTSTFSIRYIFASEEYKEFVNSQFNDVFAFFVDGANIAVVPGGTDPVTINTINHLKNTGLYRDNPAGSNKFGTSFDGFTTELTAVAQVSPGTPHHIRLAIADTSDANLDSAVFLAQGGIAGSGVATALLPDLSAFEDTNGAFVATNLDETDVNVTVFGVPDDITAQMSASGLPDDSTVTFTPIDPLGPNTPRFKMHIKIGPDTPAGSYPLVIRAGVGDTEIFGTMFVVVDCVPPFILGTPGHQPAGTTVTSGQKATLSVSPTGAAPFRYQWYTGHSGATGFPIAGATSPTFTTPAITTATEFWVRVSNPCGSVDSQTAAVAPR
jgi:Ig-like domain-containing protein